MRNPIVASLLICLVTQLTFARVMASAYPTNKSLVSESRVNLTRANPDGWFTLLIPPNMGEVERFADVDGGFYRTSDLEIKYSYWTFENTPNWLRDTAGRYSTRPLLACSRRALDTNTFRTRIDGRRAIIQACSQTDERIGSRYVYYVTFPRLRVPHGPGERDGMFSLTIAYKDRQYLPIAARIVRSLDFM